MSLCGTSHLFSYTQFSFMKDDSKCIDFMKIHIGLCLNILIWFHSRAVALQVTSVFCKILIVCLTWLSFKITGSWKTYTSWHKIWMYKLIEYLLLLSWNAPLFLVQCIYYCASLLYPYVGNHSVWYCLLNPGEKVWSAVLWRNFIWFCVRGRRNAVWFVSSNVELLFGFWPNTVSVSLQYLFTLCYDCLEIGGQLLTVWIINFVYTDVLLVQICGMIFLSMFWLM